MSRSFLTLVLALVAAGLCACSTTADAPKPKPPFVARSQTLEITNGIKVLTTVGMPNGFAPIAGHPPIWLQNGAEIGVIGTDNGHTIVYGLGGAGWRTGRILAAETGPRAVEAGTIVDVAASPDGMTLATAMVTADGKRLDVITRDLIATGAGNVIVSFDGHYDSASMSWLNGSTIAVGLRRHPDPPPEAHLKSEQSQDQGEDSNELDTEPPTNPADGLQLIVIAGSSSVAPLKLPCAMSQLSWSEHGVYAVGQGDHDAPPIIIDRRKSTCTRFHVHEPIHVLDWDNDDEGSFLYVGPDPSRHTIGVYKYDIATGAEKLVAVSTAAASFTDGGDIIALGSQKLTFRGAIEHPEEPMLAQVAISEPDQGSVDLKSLGFNTTPNMFAESTMAYSKGSDDTVMQIYAPSAPVPWRKIVTYSLRTDTAFLLAAGPARGTVTMSWSPKGRWVAILDGDTSTGTVLSVLVPPR
ncbi:MAG TPA: hypothetical protein VNO74_06480 [Methylomirabilota bacterium]|nr:hypothetical protein [Methylomirabilota bacterium]